MATDGETARRRSLSPRARRLIRSYGLLVAIAVAFMLIAMMVKSVDRTEPLKPTPAATAHTP